MGEALVRAPFEGPSVAVPIDTLPCTRLCSIESGLQTLGCRILLMQAAVSCLPKSLGNGGRAAPPMAPFIGGATPQEPRQMALHLAGTRPRGAVVK